MALFVALGCLAAVLAAVRLLEGDEEDFEAKMRATQSDDLKER